MPQVWIDTDMGFDDLAAILTVAAAPDWSIAGLSLVAGNAPLPVVADNAARAAACFGWRMPIHRGRAAPIVGQLVTARTVLGEDALRTLGRSLPSERAALSGEGAVTALIAHLARGAAMILALGPLTNIAVALLVRPDLAPQVRDLIWLGGSAGAGNHTAAAEFNAFVDPEAVQVVVDAGVRITMVGLDVCRQVRVTEADVAAVRATGGERAQLLADLLGGYVAIASAGPGSMYLYDPVAAAALVAPGAMDFRPAHLSVELSGARTRGMTVVEWRVPRRAEANARIAVGVHEALVRATVLGALAAAAREGD